jgi:hypothetical protein
MNKQQQKEQCSSLPPRIFFENPYDLETVFESLSIASDHGKELLFMDKFILYLRLHPQESTANVCYDVLRSLDILKLEKTT